MRSRSPEVLLSGPAGTGKSRSCLELLHLLATLYAGFRGLILRRTRESLNETALVTFEQHVVPENHPCLAGPQRSHRQRYRYPNGSEIAVGGLDKPAKIMSSEYDYAYVQEAIELSEAAWEAITTRLRNGRTPLQQLIADTNPDAPTHWLKRRCDAGRTELIDTTHADNPVYWDGSAWTPRGLAYVARLDALTGVRLLRLRHGRWVQAEGVVFDEYNPALHLIDRFPIPPDWERYWVVDFGFTNPFVCQFWARDHDDRLYRYREIYRTRRLVEDHAARMLELYEGEAAELAAARDVPLESARKAVRPVAIICDHDEEDRATLERHLGMSTRRARKAVRPGIDEVQARFRKRGDGKPGLYLMRDSLDGRDPLLEEAKRPCCWEEELDCYVWDEKRDKPLKENDHSCDGARYMAAHVSAASSWEAPTSAAAAPPPAPADRQARLRFGEDGGRKGRLFGT